ncbi:MAG: hypothetical protein R3F34_19750, partial [Planctomycetota bacterium]
MGDLWFSAGLVALAGALGALLPWTRSWSSEGMHRLVAMSAGIFLGTVVHMWLDLGVVEFPTGALGPGLLEPGPHGTPLFDPTARIGAARAADPYRSSPAVLWSAIAAGCLLVAAIERLFLSRHVGHSHGGEARHALVWRA